MTFNGQNEIGPHEIGPDKIGDGFRVPEKKPRRLPVMALALAAALIALIALLAISY